MKDYLEHLLFFFTWWCALLPTQYLTFNRTGLSPISTAIQVGFGAYTYTILFDCGQLNATVAAIVATSALTSVTYVAVRKLSPGEVLVALLTIHYLILDVFRNWTSLTGGPYGLSIQGDGEAGQFTATVTAMASWTILWAAERTKWKLDLEAIKDDSLLASTLGRSSLPRVMEVGALTGAVSGACGASFAQYMHFIEPTMFGLAISLSTISSLLLAQNRPGVLAFGAAFTVGLPEVIRFLEISSERDAYVRGATIGVVLILVTLFGTRKGEK